ncbi:MAG TPA: Hsp20/alpha crystallin family protein, partial [Planctomycetota bacterium]|nr:Hsp20/alpha crystallin family protein [Planctomycetota bacterium]
LSSRKASCAAVRAAPDAGMQVAARAVFFLERPRKRTDLQPKSKVMKNRSDDNKETRGNGDNKGNGQRERGSQSSRGNQGSSGLQRSSSRETQSNRGTPAMENVGRSQRPFTLMNQLSREMDRVFDDFWRDPFGRLPLRSVSNGLGTSLWAPAVEMHEHEGELIVRADLPGMKKEDVEVEVIGNVLTIQGERRQECDETQDGWHHTECRYGSFFRSIPLPEGVDPEQVQADFDDGVLSIRMPAPQRQDRRRNIEIKDREEMDSRR